MTIDWKRQAIEQLNWHWRSHLRPKLDGLTDDEYLWEPAPGCWSLRPRSEATTSMAVGKGKYVLDYELPEPVPPPVTTIAWRIAHIACGVFGMRTANHFGDGSVHYATIDWSPTAEGGLTYLDETYAAWSAAIAKLDDAAMSTPVGPTEGPWHDHPFGSLILHLNRETIHHGAEILLLRDLYRAQA